MIARGIGCVVELKGPALTVTRSGWSKSVQAIPLRTLTGARLTRADWIVAPGALHIFTTEHPAGGLKRLIAGDGIKIGYLPPRQAEFTALYEYLIDFVSRTTPEA